MKTLLKRYKGHFLALVAMALAALAFALGWQGGRNAADHQVYAALWEAITALPDPEQCALCAGRSRHHAPCLIDLSTGEIDELTVYQSAPACAWELLPMDRQPSGTFNFQPCLGLLAVRDTNVHTCTTYLPKEYELMNPARFCQDCRVLLAEAGLEGYVVLDLYDPDHIQAYPVRRGTSAVIRDYRVSVDSAQGGKWELCVTGLL